MRQPAPATGKSDVIVGTQATTLDHVTNSGCKGMTSWHSRENRVQAQKLFPPHHLLKN
ncbi:uncharacterized protein isoform X2 [Macaca fascicularis]|uniref:uncharacterized protein isoform X2 n=1 Tax=Macaca fascicularis TaxID=9541 RepID=UPI0032B07063